MIYHVNQTPADGTICHVRDYEDASEPALPNGWVRMSPAALEAWAAPLRAEKEAAGVAAANAAASEVVAELTRRTDAKAVLAQLEANLDIDPSNLAQASTQLRHIKRILYYLLKKDLR